jgi:hypothetical protein
MSDDDFDEVRPVRRRSRQDWDDEPEAEERDSEGDVTGGIIPYKNPLALTSYYLGVFGLIPCLGLLLGPVAIVTGVLGLRYRSQNRLARGGLHAVIGLVFGSVVLVIHIAVIVVFALNASNF